MTYHWIDVGSYKDSAPNVRMNVCCYTRRGGRRILKILLTEGKMTEVVKGRAEGSFRSIDGGGWIPDSKYVTTERIRSDMHGIMFSPFC